MKAKEAPEKIYACFGVFGLIQATEIRVTSKDVEYTRTDAFIEKACDWLEPVLKNYAGYYRGKDILGDFKKYMEE